MSSTTFIDTQFVVALINQRDQHHHQAKDLANRLAGTDLLTTNLILVEIADALARRFRAESLRIIDVFVNSANVEIVSLTDELFGDALKLYRHRSDKAWGLTDCVSFVVMGRRQIRQALTCDKHFLQAGFDALMSVVA